MQPSSLIFLVLIAFWAAFLLQHWARRREYLATARSVDRFSEAMRVLERRAPLGEYEMSGPHPPSDAISPAGAYRPGIITRWVPAPKPDTSASSGSVSALSSGDATVPQVPVRPKWSFRLPAHVSPRRVRGLSLLTSGSLAIFVSLLVAFAILPWWSFLAVVAMLVADLAWLRKVAVSERLARRLLVKARESAARPARGAAHRLDYFESACESESPFDFRSEPVREVSVDVSVGIQEPNEEWNQEPSQDRDPVDPSSWAPIPVPPPTYTLKAKAADPVLVPTVIVEPEGAQYWSLDGLVYDCELDDLVDRRHATGA